MLPKSKIIVALDTNNFNKIKKLIPKISKQIYGVKVGYQFFFNFQSKGINFLRDHKLKIFFDRISHSLLSIYCRTEFINNISPLRDNLSE